MIKNTLTKGTQDDELTPNTVAQNDMTFSYHPMPFSMMLKSKSTFNKKLDLNLYCIKRPQQTCFIRVTNPNMLAWGIEMGDMLVVEKMIAFSLVILSY